MTELRKCPDCVVLKDRLEFSKGSSYCKPCAYKRTAIWVSKNRQRAKDSIRKNQLKRRYGITVEDVEFMRDKQNNACLICCRTIELVVDHNHDTGFVRGLLCRRCNTNLGWYEPFQEQIQTYVKSEFKGKLNETSTST